MARPRTDAVSKPFFLHIIRVPHLFREISRTFVDIDKLDQFRVKMRVPERPVGHQGVIEVLGINGVPLENVELRKFGLEIGPSVIFE